MKTEGEGDIVMGDSASFKEIARGCVADLMPYKPGKPASDLTRELGIRDVLKFASNESPLGPSPLAVEAMEKAAREVNRYPDGGCYYLRQKLSERLGFSMDELIVGSGSNELINVAMCIVIDPGDEVIISDPSFIMYAIAVRTMGGVPVFVPSVNLAHDLKAMAAKIGPRTKAVFVCNPNNPTGTMIGKKEVEEFMASVPGKVLVVFDEAYHEYITDPNYPDTVQHVREKKNVLVLRTFSKVYSLAGLRVGYGIAKPEIIEYFNRIRLPFNVTTVAQAAATASLDDPDQVRRSREVNEEGMDYLTREFKRLGLGVTESFTNFLLVDLRGDGIEIARRLEEMGLIVRPMRAFRLPDRYVRITVGLPHENKRLVQGLERICTQGAGDRIG
jgi:histidinol-phosphate aminotransferase